MRVLFLGHTGINKRSCVERLALNCLTAAGLTADLDNINSRAYLRVFHLENFIGHRVAGDYISFLDLFHTHRQASEWNAAWESMIVEGEQTGSQHIFVSLHATYFRRNRFFSVADLNLLRAFSPNIIITLIDDAFECWHRIRERERLLPRGTNLRLRDIFLWRTVEIMAGDLLSHALGVSNYVVATKHPAVMVRRLILEPAIKRIYASFPISSTRDHADRRRDVDDFRRSLHERFTMFDPLTIDERVLTAALKNNKEGDPYVGITLDQRWPPWLGGDLETLATPYDGNYPLSVPVDQIEESIIDIDRQIEARDFRLIDSVQAVAAFRPNFNKHQSRGVSAELQYAAQTVGIPVHLTWDDDADGIYADSPFGNVGTKHLGTSQLISALGD
jgi:adenylate kinase